MFQPSMNAVLAFLIVLNVSKAKLSETFVLCFVAIKTGNPYNHTPLDKFVKSGQF